MNIAESSPAPDPEAAGHAGVIGRQWPTLARAVGRYEQQTAERFTALAYDAVITGVIRLDDRERLAAAAADAGIKPFDAQLLIACAARQWALDHRFDPRPTLAAPTLSFEYRSFRKACLRAAILFAFAAVLDVIIILKWLS